MISKSSYLSSSRIPIALVLIYPIGKLNLIQEHNEIAFSTDLHYLWVIDGWRLLMLRQYNFSFFEM